MANSLFCESFFSLVPVKGRLNNHLPDKAPFVWPITRELGTTVVSAVILYQIDQITPGKMGNCQACGALGKSYLKIQKNTGCDKSRRAFYSQFTWDWCQK